MAIGGGVALAQASDATFRFEPISNSETVEFIPNPDGSGNLAAAVILEAQLQAGTAVASGQLTIVTTGTIRTDMPRGTTAEFPGQPFETGIDPPCGPESVIGQGTLQRICQLGAIPVGGEIDAFITFTRSATDPNPDAPVRVRFTGLDSSGALITFQNGARFLEVSLPVVIAG